MRPALFVSLLGAALAAAFALGSCDYFLMGTYTGLCDEPRSLYGYDMGNPAKVRMAQCQVQGNICCRKRDPVTGKFLISGLTIEKRTYCLQPWECYLGTEDADCLGDVDCVNNLACIGGNVSTGTLGKCLCPSAGVACKDAKGGIFCCPAGSTCGQAQCVEPPATDMSSVMPEVDLRATADLRRRDGA